MYNNDQTRRDAENDRKTAEMRQRAYEKSQLDLKKKNLERDVRQTETEISTEDRMYRGVKSDIDADSRRITEEKYRVGEDEKSKLASLQNDLSRTEQDLQTKLREKDTIERKIAEDKEKERRLHSEIDDAKRDIERSSNGTAGSSSSLKSHKERKEKEMAGLEKKLADLKRKLDDQKRQLDETVRAIAQIR